MSGSSPNPNENDAPSTVIVWDRQNSRFQVVSRIITDCQARPCRIQSLLALRGVHFSSHGSVAVVGLGRQPSKDDFALHVIRGLKEAGLTIVSYEDGAHSWSLGTQCLPLLAGSLKLLDSARAEFVAELRALLDQLLQAEKSRRTEQETIKRVMAGLGVVGESQTMISIFRWILRVSVLSDFPVLITGETGTGKQILASAISRLDPKRRNEPFIAINCGAINPSLAESELFGHRRGAFTGADRDRKGLVRSAHGGILFLDEIGELDDVLQTKLLRMLQEKSVLGVGEDHETAVDVRVIAATNRDLDKMVQHRMFRADLYHRLNVLSIHVPPLAERPADVKPLIEHFLKKYHYLKPGAPLSVAGDFLEALMQLGLPGNVRQLENLVRQSLVNKEDNSALNLSDLPIEVWRQLSKETESPVDPPGHFTEKVEGRSGSKTLPQEVTSHLVKMLDTDGWHLSRSLEWCERFVLEAALRKASGNQSQAARLLGITSRSVYNKIRKHNLTPH